MNSTYALPCPHGVCPGERRKASRRLARAARFALVGLALVLMIFGARWILDQPSAATEFAAASYVFDDIGLPHASAADGIDHEKAKHE